MSFVSYYYFIVLNSVSGNLFILLPDCVQNGNDVKKEEYKITNGQAESSLLAALDKGNCNVLNYNLIYENHWKLICIEKF